ncbi:MAG: sigma-70 family RNA polymerase sigma factor [Planctomycetota bacterium]
MTDWDYLQAYVDAADQHALGVLVSRHRPLVYSICRRVLKNHDDALDVTQEVFLKFCQHASEIERDVTNWLAQCASNTSISYIRSNAARRRRESAKSHIEAIGWDNVLEKDEAAAIVRQCIAEFDPSDRRLIESHIIHEHSQAATARVMGISQQAVSKKLTGLRQQLRWRLVKRGITGLSAAMAAMLPSRVIHACAAALFNSVSLLSPSKPVVGLLAIGATATLTCDSVHLTASPDLPQTTPVAMPSDDRAGLLGLSEITAEPSPNRRAAQDSRRSINARRTDQTKLPVTNDLMKAPSAYMPVLGSNHQNTNQLTRGQLNQPPQLGDKPWPTRTQLAPVSRANRSPVHLAINRAESSELLATVEASQVPERRFEVITGRHRRPISGLRLLLERPDNQPWREMRIHKAKIDLPVVTLASEATPLHTDRTLAFDVMRNEKLPTSYELERVMDRRQGRITTRLTLLSAALMLPPSYTLAGVTVDNPDQSAYNALSADPTYDSVGLVTSGSSLASGVYLGEGWVVTAAHVVDSGNGYDFTIDGTTYQAQEIYIYDEWDGDAAAGNDIALIQLTTDVQGVDPAALYQPTGVQDELIGQTATYTGYGQTGQGSTGASGSTGSFGAGQNQIDAFGGDNFMLSGYDDSIFFSDFDDPQSATDGLLWSDNNALATEYLIAPGDSGGGVFVEIEGQDYLVGVNSFLLALDGEADSDYGDLSGTTYLPDYYDWVYSVTGDDLFVGSVPEPNTLILLSAGSLFVLRRRCRSGPLL